MELSRDENFSLSNPLGELVLSPTSYTSTFCSIHPNEVWVKGFFLMMPHEEYGTPISLIEWHEWSAIYFTFAAASFVILR